jgi:glutamate dehydrogenase (NAD(P)+)
VSFVTREALKHFKMDGKVKIAVQGMGNVGSISAKLLHAMGHKIVAVSDVDGGYYNPDGLDIPAILEYLAGHKQSLNGYTAPGVKKITNAELLACECDVLVPCALQNQLTAENAGAVKAKLVVEGANGPVTVEADEILAKRGIPSIPDILANAGGVVVSYFEWVQNIQELTWEEDQINATLEKIMVRSFQQVEEIVNEKSVSFRIAAYMLAISKLVRAKKARGVFP